MGKGSKRRPGKIPADCPLWKGYKPSWQKSEKELSGNTGRFVLVGDRLVKNVQTPDKA